MSAFSGKADTPQARQKTRVGASFVQRICDVLSSP